MGMTFYPAISEVSSLTALIKSLAGFLISEMGLFGYTAGTVIYTGKLSIWYINIQG